MQTPDQRREYWNQHVLEWRKSGLTQRAYCQPLNLKRHQLSYWNNVLKKPSKAKEKVISSGFATVNIRRPEIEELTLSFPSGIRLIGIKDCHLSVVKEMVGMLK